MASKYILQPDGSVAIHTNNKLEQESLKLKNIGIDQEIKLNSIEGIQETNFLNPISDISEISKELAKENSGESYKKDPVDKVDLNTNTQSLGSLINTLAVGGNLNTADSKTLEPNLLHFTEQNKSFNFISEDLGNIIPTFKNFNSFADEGSNKIFVNELELLAAHPSLAGKNSNSDFFEKKYLFFMDYLLEIITFITINEAVSFIYEEFNGDSDVVEDFNLVIGDYTFKRSGILSSYFLKILNYPTKLSNTNDRIASFMLGVMLFLKGDEAPIGFIKDLVLGIDQVDELIKKGVQNSLTRIITTSALYLVEGLFSSKAKNNQIDLLIRKFQMQKYWHDDQLYQHKPEDGSSEKLLVEFKYYYYKFAIERMHVGLKYLNYKYFDLTYDVKNETPYTRFGVNRLNLDEETGEVKFDEGYRIEYQDTVLIDDKGDFDNPNKSLADLLSLSSTHYYSKTKYVWRHDQSGRKGNMSYRNRGIPQLFQLHLDYIANKFISSQSGTRSQVLQIDETLRQNFAFSKNSPRLPNELVQELESQLDKEYVPFYFHDIRTNEVISFHAFIDNLTDSYSPNYQQTTGFGRIDEVRNYVNTSRTIQLSFLMVSTSPDDHDMMWYQINKLVAMCYPQWSPGIAFANQNDEQKDKLKPPNYPFTQMPTASPLIRLRVGDLLKSNYSRQALSRLHGIEKNNNYQELKRTLVRHYYKNSIVYAEPDPDLPIEYDIGDKPEKAHDLPEYFLLPGLYRIEDGNFFFNSKKYYRLNYEAQIYQIKKITNDKNNLKVKIYDRKLKEKPTLYVSKFNIIRKYRSEFGYHAQYTGKIVFDGGRNKKVKPNKNDSRFQEYLQKSLEFKDKDRKEDKQPEYLKDFQNDIINPVVKEETVDKTKSGRDIKTTKEKVNNPFTAAFESAAGKGLAGFITSLNLGGLMDAPWETRRDGSKGPMYIKIDIGFAPIHDIPPGLDHNGMLRAPSYNIGRLMNEMFDDVYDNRKPARIISSAENKKENTSNDNS